MPAEEEKNAIHPVSIFKQGWSVCRKNLGKLSVIYLIFNLPITVISLSPVFRPLPNQKPGLAGVLWFLFLIVISSWQCIALLLGANQAVEAKDYTVGQSISQAQAFLVKYLALSLSVTLFMMGIMIVAGISAAVVGAFLWKVNAILTVLICSALIIVVIAFLVYCMLRWSLAWVACVFENSWPIPAVKRSFSLVQSKINPVVGIYGLMALVYIAYLTPAIIAGMLSGVSKRTSLTSQANLAVNIVLLIIGSVMAPFLTTMTVVLYKKLKEALGAHVYA